MIPKFPRNGVGPCLALVLLVAAVLACGRGSSRPCTATVTYQGKTYTGAGKKDEAALFACNRYCRDDDPEYDAMYRIWLSSPEGRAAGQVSKEEAIYKSKRLLDYVTITCANRCVDWTKSGRAQAETKCE
ncbi:MAG: hypothetical protein ACT4OT_06500 [Acidobacteriota bacterium]